MGMHGGGMHMHQGYGPPMGGAGPYGQPHQAAPQMAAWDPNYGMYYGAPAGAPQMAYGGYAGAGYGGYAPVYAQAAASPVGAGGRPYGGGGGDGDRGPPGANLFVFNIPDSFGDADLAGLFASFGTLMSSKVFIDKATGRGKGFGFVSMSSPAEAEAAIAGMNGREVMGRTLKVGCCCQQVVRSAACSALNIHTCHLGFSQEARRQ